MPQKPDPDKPCGMEAHAQAMAARGFRIHPLRPGDKAPVLEAWQQRATTDPSVIRSWFAADPGINYGVAGGGGLLLVDLDKKPEIPAQPETDGRPAVPGRPAVDGLADLARLEETHGALPETFTVATPGGGRHLYLRGPDVANSVGHLAPGIDIRSAGAYVVGPGSYFADPGGRKGYTGPYVAKESGYGVATVADLPQAPAWLLSMLYAPAPRGPGESWTGTLPYELDTPENRADVVGYLQDEAPVAIDGVNGNKSLFDVACECRDRGVTHEVALALAWEHYNPRCLGPWTDSEDKTWTAPFASAYGGNAQNKMPGTKSRSAAMAGFVASAMPLDDTTAAAPSSYPEPADLWSEHPVPELPKGVLPRVIEDFASEIGDLRGVDPALVAMAGLTVCAAATSDRIQLQVKPGDNWMACARLWTFGVGWPSSKKTPGLKAAMEPLWALHHRRAEDHKRILNARAGYSVSQRKQLDEQGTSDLPPPPPPLRQLIVGDTTTEGVREVIAANPDGLLLYQDEFAGFFASLDRYAGNGGKAASGDRTFWLQAYDGGTYTSTRKVGGTLIIPNLSASMLGGIQPDVIRNITEEGVHDGLLQRFLPVVMRRATLGREDADTASGRTGPAVVGRYRNLVFGLSKMLDDPTRFCPTLRFDADAQKLRRSCEIRYQRQAEATEGFSKISTWFGKAEGVFARLCVTFHCIRWVEMMEGFEGEDWLPEPPPAVVTFDTARRVAEFMDQFLIPHAQAFYEGVLQHSREHEKLAALAGFILARGLTKLNRRQAQSGLSAARGLSNRELDPLMERLCNLGWLDLLPQVPGRAPVWEVNPVVHERFKDRAAAERARKAAARRQIEAAAAARREGAE